MPARPLRFFAARPGRTTSTDVAAFSRVVAGSRSRSADAALYRRIIKFNLCRAVTGFKELELRINPSKPTA